VSAPVRTVLRGITTHVALEVDLPPCCPITGNPLEGSTLRLTFIPNDRTFPVEDLEELVREYVGGHKARDIRGMEEMIQDLAQRACASVGVPVRAEAQLRIIPPQGGTLQRMIISVAAVPA
jgi:7-cyano-7-deazaguanine reductase